ncbi:MAG: DMT family transporter [Rhodobacteraceae bacterium]|nr:DMT family transporter [Paracoccaceae bacterium]
MTSNPNALGALYMTAAMLGFTLNDAAMKLVTGTVPLFQAVFLRGLLTTVLLVAVVWMLGGLRFSIPRSDRGRVAWRTLFEIGAMVTFLTALIHMPIANATAILAALPLAVTLGATLFLKEPLGWRRITAILVGAVGVLMIVQPGMAGFNIYALWALAAVAMVTGRDLVTRRFSPAVPSMGVAVITAFGVAVAGGLLSVGEVWVIPDARDLMLVAFAAVMLIGAYVFSVLAMRVGEVGAVAPFRYTSLVFALVVGWLVFSEWPNDIALAGAALVMATGIYTLARERMIRHRAARRAADQGFS